MLVGGIPNELPAGDSIIGWGTVLTVIASYVEVATNAEKVVKVAASGLTITLPSAVGNTARLTYKLMVAGNLTIAAATGQTIDDGATAVLVSRYAAITLVSDNANWIII